MLTTLRLKILLGLIFIPILSFSQASDKEFHFPDIPGYHTLKCDFHMHTVFSDGQVWPTVRVQEAVREGLDAISITEHLEYYSHGHYISGDHNSSYEIAKPYADKKGLILIRGAEITKGMPPGHFNFLFIQDANAIDSVDWKQAIIQANEQGAFVMWNHPGWTLENEIPIWYEEHSWLLSQGLIQGIEIVNENSYYPLAHQWGIDSNLTIMGNSDIHAPIDFFFDKCVGEHRPLTLVFAEEKTEEGIREALDQKRTAIYYKDLLIGDEELLGPLFKESIEFFAIHNQGSNTGPKTFIKNNASVDFQIAFIDDAGMEYDPILVQAGMQVDFNYIKGGKWMVKNIIIAPGKSLIVNL